MMTLSEAIQTAYAQEAFGHVPTKLESLRKAYARAIVATWSASCASDRYVDLNAYHAAERQARKALDAHLAETSDYLPAYCS